VAPYWPMGVMFIITVIYYNCIDWVNDKFKFKDIGECLWELEEGLSNYWAALSTVDRRWIEREESYRRKAIDMPMMTEE